MASPNWFLIRKVPRRERPWRWEANPGPRTSPTVVTTVEQSKGKKSARCLVRRDRRVLDVPPDPRRVRGRGSRRHCVTSSLVQRPEASIAACRSNRLPQAARCQTAMRCHRYRAEEVHGRLVCWIRAIADSPFARRLRGSCFLTGSDGHPPQPAMATGVRQTRKGGLLGSHVLGWVWLFFSRRCATGLP